MEYWVLQSHSTRSYKPREEYFCGVVLKAQSTLLPCMMVLAKGTIESGPNLDPASINNTVKLELDVNLLANTEPAVPAPTETIYTIYK